MKLIGIAIVVLLVVGFKSYVLYYYEPIETDVHIGSAVKIERNQQKPNHKLEALSYYLDSKYKTNDNGETYTFGEKVEGESSIETETEKSNKTLSSGTITFGIKHNVIENLSIEDKKLQKVDYIPFMKYSNLNNEMDLVNYYINQNEKKSNLYDLIYQVGTKYLSSVFVKGMGLEKEIKELDGLDGYLLKEGLNTKVMLFHQGNSYELTFSEEFAEEDIVEILNGFEFQ